MNNYNDKPLEYFDHARTEISSLLPVHCGRVLELGCGGGATLAWLRRQNRLSEAVGIEISPKAAALARPHLDAVHCFDFESALMPDPKQQFDVILCLDVLEHMGDPWAVVKRLVEDNLAQGGTLVISLPNVRHYSVLVPLLLEGNWDYQDAGILDRTHVRFFTHSTAETLLAHPSLGAVQWLRSAPDFGTLKGWIKALTWGKLRGFLTYQLILAVEKKV